MSELSPELAKVIRDAVETAARKLYDESMAMNLAPRHDESKNVALQSAGKEEAMSDQSGNRIQAMSLEEIDTLVSEINKVTQDLNSLLRRASREGIRCDVDVQDIDMLGYREPARHITVESYANITATRT
jgi:hypothetical protein